MSDLDDFTYMGLHWLENMDSGDYGPEVTLYDIYRPVPGVDGEVFIASARREQVDPDGPPKWGIALFGVPSTLTWFSTRLKAVEYIKEHIR